MQAKAALTRHLDTLLMSQEKKKKKANLEMENHSYDLVFYNFRMLHV